MSTKSILIVGAGFAGINAAKKLARYSELKLTIVDRRNHHLFQPLLYQVATAGLSPADIAMPVRKLFSPYQNVEVLLDEAVSFHPQQNEVEFRSQTLKYDYLILACGANHSYFGKNEWEEFAPGLKTIEQATEIRRRILTAFEEAEKEEDPEKREAWMTFVIVGGGPTGVELAGAIAELGRNTIRADFRRIDPRKSKIILIEADSKVLSKFGSKLADHAKTDLNRLGVDLKLSTRVTDVTGEGVRTDQAWIASKTVIWAAGVAPSITGRSLQQQAGENSVELDRSGRVQVEPDLSIRAFPNIFVLGDQARVIGEDGTPLPGLAPVAMQEGRHAAKNVLRRIQGKPTEVFHYVDKGMMATIGRKKAVVQAGRFRLTGLFAWVAWLFIHIYYLIGFRNRLFVFLEWVWAYVWFSNGVRLITSKNWRLKP